MLGFFLYYFIPVFSSITCPYNDFYERFIIILFSLRVNLKPLYAERTRLFSYIKVKKFLSFFFIFKYNIIFLLKIYYNIYYYPTL